MVDYQYSSESHAAPKQGRKVNTAIMFAELWSIIIDEIAWWQCWRVWLGLHMIALLTKSTYGCFFSSFVALAAFQIMMPIDVFHRSSTFITHISEFGVQIFLFVCAKGRSRVHLLLEAGVTAPVLCFGWTPLILQLISPRFTITHSSNLYVLSKSQTSRQY